MDPFLLTRRLAEALAEAGFLKEEEE